MKSGLTTFASLSATSGIALTNLTGKFMSSRTAGACKSRITIPSQLLANSSAITLAEMTSPFEKRLSCLEYP